MSLDRHSRRTEHTQRSAKAFRFGLLGGRANGRIPLDRRLSKHIFLRSALAATVTVASADTLSYVVAVNTPNFGAPGWIDFSFNQANALTSLPATATITNFQQTGYTLDSATETSPGVTGTLIPGPVVIPNDGAGANFFTQGIASWGSFFSFTVILSGPAVGTAAPDGSAFRVTLFDSSFIPFVSPLTEGEVANITINPAGTLSTSGSTFGGWSATVAAAPSAVPEPATAWLLAPIAAALLLMRRRATIIN